MELVDIVGLIKKNNKLTQDECKIWFINNMGIDTDNNSIVIDYKCNTYNDLLLIDNPQLGQIAEVATSINNQWWNIAKTTRLKGIYSYNGSEWIRPDFTSIPKYSPIDNGDSPDTTEIRTWSPKILSDFIGDTEIDGMLKINDSIANETTVYSSNKVEELNNVTLGLLVGKAEIDDEQISSGMTYSSSKIENDKYSMNIDLNNKIGLKLDITNYTASDILTKLKTVDGVGSGLDADLLDGLSSGSFATSVQGIKADNALPATSNAISASKLFTPRNISLTGSVNGSASFDGSNDLTINATVSNNSHAHQVSNIDGLQAIIDTINSRLTSIESAINNSTGIVGSVAINKDGSIIRSGGNISSVARTAAGCYTITFIMAYMNSDYYVFGTTTNNSGATDVASVSIVSKSSTNVKIATEDLDGNYADYVVDLIIVK